MFNNTSTILACPNLLSSNGVILPNSNKVLYAVDIDRRIEKVKNHINYLEQNIAHRNTHGGKNFRAHNISIQSQIFIVSKRLELLQQARNIIAGLDKQSDLVYDYQHMFEAALYGTFLNQRASNLEQVKTTEIDVDSDTDQNASDELVLFDVATESATLNAQRLIAADNEGNDQSGSNDEKQSTTQSNANVIDEPDYCVIYLDGDQIQ